MVNMKKNFSALLLVLLLAFVLITSACSNIVQDSSSHNISEDVKISNFGSEQEFRDFLESAQLSSGYTGRLTGSFESVDMVAEPALDSNRVSDKASLDYSETNIQVEGVDELDILKTDGDYIYTSSGKDLFIVSAYPAQDAEIVSVLNSGNTITGLFVEEDILAVVGTVDDFDDIKEEGFSSRSGLTFVDFYDISDKKNPELVKEYKFDGRYFNARLFEGVVYLSTNYDPFRRPSPMPIILEGGVSRTMPVSDIYAYNTNYNSPSFVSIHSIRMDDWESVDSKIFTLEGSNYMYMSHNNIYLTYSEIINRHEVQQDMMINEMLPLLPASDREYIDRIKKVDDDILNKHEKQSKIVEVVYNYVSHLKQSEQDKLEEEIKLKVKEKLKDLGTLEYTVIHKISVDDGLLKFEESNKVPGSIYGQFALDERDGILRVATTIREGMRVSDEYDIFDWRSRSPSINNVYTLDENMNLLGALEGLAPTESIYSARYVDDRLYMVTFRQIDPFFVIDLSNPKSPEELGELKITGYSRYLHPYDEDTIIGLGREGTETGTIQGLKISLFDVSDVANPEEIVTYVSDDTRSSSSAEWEHKAFLFSKNKDLLVIPVRNHDYRSPENNYAGALVFKINKDEIFPKGIITHAKGSSNIWNQEVERSLYIEDYLYTKSSRLLRINELESLKSLKNVTLSSSNEGSIPIY